MTEILRIRAGAIRHLLPGNTHRPETGQKDPTMPTRIAAASGPTPNPPTSSKPNAGTDPQLAKLAKMWPALGPDDKKAILEIMDRAEQGGPAVEETDPIAARRRRLPQDEWDRLRARMGMPAAHRGVELKGRTQTFRTMTQDQARERIAAKKSGCAR